ncbi:NADPH-dependent oxidoreductase [Rhodococcus sp. PAMC28707]|uniref:NADPH-dependent FMN reductase n=1 Tax=unclassified Rhodococcus (in: high G+C Gram-positive bacteria) TaxID=192944 RepID=UPI00109D8B13|nr:MULTISPECIES: NAD(P)H-dependent oxidoreductase [unclassified Rhodococcus (in: high G+C Gram-positive bacteria)]QCB52659.1 NADPH-dependent oxidoreductase [Rhodococcus sp. PAMC28705]QCB60794.1 NADPH-dependent oxidoreductase [Rhodococcus sp. PAMC28707]
MDPIGLAVVLASVRPGRVGPVVADWFLRTVSERSDVVATKIDLMDAALPVDLSPSPAGEAFAAAIGAVDAVVVVTPEYNHGYPGALKTALDTVKYQWRGKPIGFVSYGGLGGGLRATEQLRQVAAELHMVAVRDSVGFHRVRTAFDENGRADDGAAVDAAGRMLSQLHWWATASKVQSRAFPYPG